MAPPHSQRYFPGGTPASCNALYTKPHSHLQKVTEAIFKLGYLISNDGARRSSAAQPLFLVATVFQETAREDPEKLLGASFCMRPVQRIFKGGTPPIFGEVVAECLHPVRNATLEKGSARSV